MRAARLKLRVDEQESQLIRDAASTARISVSSFLERAAVKEAHRQLADQTGFQLSAEQWDAFVAALDRPPRHLPDLDRAIAAYRERYDDDVPS